MSKSTPSRRAAASPLANPRLLLPLLLVVVVGGYYGFAWWRDASQRAAERRRLIEQTAAELAMEAPDRDQLSKLFAGLKKQPDAGTARDLLYAQASIKYWLDDSEAAYDLFDLVASDPSATAEELRLAARILLRRHESANASAPESASMLHKVVQYTTRAIGISEATPEDLLRAWQGTERAFDHARAATFAEELERSFPESGEARFVAFVRGPFARGEFGLSQLDGLPTLSPEPVELRCMRSLALLQAGQVADARRRAEQEDLLYAPGVWLVRYAMAIIDHACAAAPGLDPAERERCVQHRDRQLTWLAERAPADEPLRSTWMSMRNVR